MASRRGGWGSSPYKKARKPSSKKKAAPKRRQQLFPSSRPGPKYAVDPSKRGAFRPPGLAQFMAALAGQESGGNPAARNRLSGAYGTFQIMPANWASWAREAGLPANAPRTARNQEIVARAKLSQYYNQFGNWAAVAVAWYAGPAAAVRWLKNPNDPFFRRGQRGGPPIAGYVQQVLRRMGDPKNVRGLRAPTGIQGPMDERQVAKIGSQIASQYGLRISSHKRSPAHNKRVGGAKRSDHLTGMAIDLTGHPQKMRALANWARANMGPGKLFRYVAYGDKGHRDHVHLSFNKANRGMEFDLESSGGGGRTAGWGSRRPWDGSGGMGEMGEMGMPEDEWGIEGYTPTPEELAAMGDEWGIEGGGGFGGQSERDLLEHFKNQAKAMYPAIADEIDRGITPRQYADPYFQMAAEALEMNPDSMDLKDPKWKRFLEKTLPDGKKGVMPLWEWEKHLRTDPIYGWDKTKNAHATAADLADSLLRSFGFIG